MSDSRAKDATIAALRAEIASLVCQVAYREDEIAALRALVARKNAALEQAADALDDAHSFAIGQSPIGVTFLEEEMFRAARDAARKAAQEGE